MESKKNKIKGGASFLVKGIEIPPMSGSENFKGLKLPNKIASFTNKFKCN